MILPACRQAGATHTMQFTISNIHRSVNDIMRAIGYSPAYFQNEGEFSIVRKVAGRDYPRFHLYIIQELPRRPTSGNSRDLGKENSFIFNLHLDQKKPSYKGARGHGGEYDGSVVEGEAERIKRLLK